MADGGRGIPGEVELVRDLGDTTTARWDDVFQAAELCYELGWTDGLPVVPPTVQRVQQFLDYAGRPADEVLGSVPERRREDRGAGDEAPGRDPRPRQRFPPLARE